MRLAAVVAALVLATVVAVGLAGLLRRLRRLRLPGAGPIGVDARVVLDRPARRAPALREASAGPARDADRLRMTIASYHRPMPPLHLTIVGADGRAVVDRTVPDSGDAGRA